jgi:hypothetical protein
MDTDHSHRGGYETRDVRFGGILAAAIGLGLLIVGTFVGMRVMLGALAERAAGRSPPASPLAAYAPTEPPAPRLQAEPIKDLETLRAAEDALLHSYAWIDRERGTVRIPIERAIEIIAARTAGTARPSAPGGEPQ